MQLGLFSWVMIVNSHIFLPSMVTQFSLGSIYNEAVTSLVLWMANL
jgi:hypothetical protein